MKRQVLAYVLIILVLVMTGCTNATNYQSHLKQVPPSVVTSLPTLGQLEARVFGRELSKVFTHAGAEYYSPWKSPGATITANNIDLKPDGVKVEWSVYQFHLGQDTAPYYLTVTLSEPANCWIGISNYKFNVWDWSYGEQIGKSTYSINLNKIQRPVSKLTNLYVAVVAYKSKYSVVELKLDAPNISDVEPGDWWMFGREPSHNRLSPYKGPNTKVKKWSFDIGPKSSSSVAIRKDGAIYIASGSGILYCLNTNGTEKWRLGLGSSVQYSSPAIAPDGTVYVGTSAGNLVAVKPNGTKAWDFPTGQSIFSSPAIAPDGTVYFGSFNNKFYAVTPGGDEKWNFDTGNIVECSPAIDKDGVVYFGSWNKYFYAFNPNGTEKWKFETGSINTTAPAIASDGTIYVPSVDKKLYALKPDGGLKWTYEFPDVVSRNSPGIGADGIVYIGCVDKKLYAIKPDGTKYWEFATGDAIDVSSPAIDSDGIVYIGSHDKNLYAIYPTGSKKWSFATSDIIYSSPALDAYGIVYFCSWDADSKVYAVGEAGVTLDAPTNVKASDATYPDKIEITWDKVKGATNYVIYRDFVGTPIDTVGDVDYYNDTLVSDFNKHNYYVAASDGIYNGPISVGDVGQRYSEKIPAPTNVYATSDNYPADKPLVALEDKIVISWSEVTEAKGYKVYRMDDYTDPIATLGKVLTYDDTSVKQPDTATHEYRVKSYNDKGESDWSITVFGNLKNITQKWNTSEVYQSSNEPLDVKAVMLSGGNPAVCTHFMTSGELRYFAAKNNTPAASGDWNSHAITTISTSPVDTVDTSNPPIDFTMEVVDGKPMVAFFNPSGDGTLQIAASQTAAPSAVADWKTYTIKQPEAGKKLICKYISITELNKQPVLSYLYNYYGSETHLEYARAKVWPPTGVSDFVTVDIDKDDTTFTLNYNTNVLVLSDSTPAIVYYKNNTTAIGSGVQFAYSKVTEPIAADWLAYPMIENNYGIGTGYYSSAVLIDKKPVVASYNSVNHYPMYHYPLIDKPTQTSDWKRCLIEGGFTDRGKYISLVEWNGLPMMSYLDKTNKTMRFGYGSNLTPRSFYDWTIGPTTDNATYNYTKWSSIVICNNKPAYSIVQNHLTAPIWTINYVRLVAP